MYYKGGIIMLKTILFTHDDLDGAGCYVIFEMAHQHLVKDTDYKIISGSIPNIDENCASILFSKERECDKNTIICFADICPSRSVLEEVCKMYVNVFVWDHHKTNTYAMDVCKNADIRWETINYIQQCGTSVMYEYFSTIAHGNNSKDSRGDYFNKKGNQKLISDFVENVRSYDTFGFKRTGNRKAKELCTLFFLLGMETFCKRMVERLKSEGDQIILDTEYDFIKPKLAYEQQMIDKIDIEDVHVLTIRGLKCALIFNAINISELSSQFLTKHPELDVMIGINIPNRTLSFRTNRDDVDVGYTLALPVGGGGHPKAAGCTIPDGYIQNIFDMIRVHLDDISI